MITDAREAIKARLLAVVQWLLWSPRRLAAAVTVVVLALVLAVQLQPNQTAPTATPTPTPEAAGWPRATAYPNGGLSPTPDPSQEATPAVPSTAVRSLKGRDLANAWLTGYLTRPTRDDEAWIAAVQDLTTPELLAQLETEGPDGVGLFKLASWRVAAIAPYKSPDQPVDTPSRMVLPYLVSVTDGTVTERKPFLLYSYRNEDDRWLVAMVEQPYTSEG